MVQLSNTPRSLTPLTLEASKSFSLGLWFQNADGETVDLTGATLRMVVADQPRFGGATVITREATISTPTLGLAQIDLQASDLDLPAREHAYTLTLVTAEGYSAVVAKGPLTVVANQDEAWSGPYTSVPPSQSLTVQLMDRQVLSVIVNHLLAPGISVGAVTTVAYGNPAGAEIVGTYPHLLLNLTVPEGMPGVRGDQGDKGDQGDQGEQGDPGPAGPAAHIAIGSVTQAASGNPPSATLTGDPVAGYLLNLVIPPPAAGGGGSGSLVTLTDQGDGTGKVEVDFSSSLQVLMKPTGFSALPAGQYALVMDGSGHWTGLTDVITPAELAAATFDGGSL